MDRSPSHSVSGGASALVAALPRVLVVLHDLVMAWFAWAALEVLRFRIGAGSVEMMLFSPMVALVLLTQSASFWGMGLYRGLWRFASVPDMVNIAKAGVVGLMAIAVELLVFDRMSLVSRAMLALYPVVLVALVGGPRLLYRAWKDKRLAVDARHPVARVLVLGAGRTGEALVRRMAQQSPYQPVGLLDDDRRLHGRRVQGVQVLGSIDALPEMVRETDAQLIAIAIPTLAAVRMQQIVALCDQAGVAFRRVPRLTDLLATGSASGVLQEVAIEDLLGREPVACDRGAIRAWLAGRSVLVTGAGGSIGAELCRQMVLWGAGTLTLVERDELALITIADDIRRRAPGLPLHVVLGDCGDRATIDHAIAIGRAQAVLHAAACKHVPLLETQVREAVRNNVLATQTVVAASVAAAVDRFVLISTDKAVDPVNVLGASKRLAEMVCQAGGAGATRIAIVRFGNVLDSAGSVVPIFRQQIHGGGPVTVTHPDVTRYFMTIPEACELILQAAAMDAHDALYTLDMGEPVPIRLLAEQMIRLAGQEPGKGVDIVYTGLRPGEKLHETIYHRDEESRMTIHPKIFQTRARGVDGVALQRQLAALAIAVDDFDEPRLHRLLRDAVSEYEPARDDVVVPLSAARRSHAR